MAINIPILTEFSDAGLKSAQGAFNNFKSKVGEAEGAMGKFKAGGNAALDAVKANAGTFAMAAGGAIAGFALKAIGDFQDLALEVDKFSNSTGLAAEEASKWVEVAGDIGVESNTLITAFNKLNKATADNSKAFSDLGVDIAKTASGATDVNETFLRTVDALRRVEDPAQRAKLATQVLGKSWTEVSELIEMGSTELKTALENVSDAKIIDEEEIAKAKRFRDAQDALADAFQDFTLAIGEALLPALVKLMPVLTAVAKAAGVVGAVVGDNVTAKLIEMGATIDDVVRSAQDPNDGIEMVMRDLGMTFDEVAAVIGEDLLPANYKLNKSWEEGYRAMIDAKGAAEQLNTALTDVDEALSILKGNVDERQAWRNLQDDIDQAGEAALRAFMEKTPEALRASEDALDDARLAAGNYIREIDGVPTDVKTQFIAALDQANIEQIKAILDSIAYAREVAYLPTLPPGVGGGPSEIGSGGRPIGMAPLPAIPGVKIPIGGRGGIGQMSAINLTVMGSVISENDLIEVVRKGLVNAQRNGSGLVYSNV